MRTDTPQTRESARLLYVKNLCPTPRPRWVGTQVRSGDWRARELEGPGHGPRGRRAQGGSGTDNEKWDGVLAHSGGANAMVNEGEGYRWSLWRPRLCKDGGHWSQAPGEQPPAVPDSVSSPGAWPPREGLGKGPRDTWAWSSAWGSGPQLPSETEGAVGLLGGEGLEAHPRLRPVWR